MSGALWSQQQAESLLVLRRAGIPHKQIARRLQIVSAAAVSQKINRMGIGSDGAVASGWAAADVARLVELWSTPMFAKDIGAELGRSKNSVIGKANRLGLAARRDGKTEASPPQVTLKPLRRPIATPPAQAPDIVLMSYFDLLPSSCRFIPGHPAGVKTLYCGQPVVEGESWCADHCRRVFAPKLAAKEAA